MGVTTCRNASHELWRIPRCPDDPLNELSRERIGRLPRQVGVLMHHRDGAGEPMYTRSEAVFDPPGVWRGKGRAPCRWQEDEMADGDDSVARSYDVQQDSDAIARSGH